jgi:hypothetical protein
LPVKVDAYRVARLEPLDRNWVFARLKGELQDLATAQNSKVIKDIVNRGAKQIFEDFKLRVGPYMSHSTCQAVQLSFKSVNPCWKGASL